ncbi:MAG: phosphoribosylanthranilate isomerase [Herpetosiphonaceae bacterium]|nr:phosphoribosylanthranilate isomerase [Herpetosiphonaceae bacterium]
MRRRARVTVAVKICGVRTPEAALVAAEAGADFIGLIFAPSQRQVTAERAQAIVRALRSHAQGAHVAVVGVFVDEQPAEIAILADTVGLDWVQLSGEEPPAMADKLPVPVLKAVRFDGGANEMAWLAPTITCDLTPLVVDAHVAGSWGGAGVVADWQRAAALAETHPILLAGGLNPENVGVAIQAVQPWGVDVSSGVESAGVQDHAKIRAFVRAAKEV